MVPLHQVPRGRRADADAQPPDREGAPAMTLVALALTGAVKARARELGFDRAGVGPATPPPHAAAFETWLDAGHAATMSYLARGRADRLDPTRLLPGARSVVAVALSYKPESDDASWHGVASYARGADYHDVLRERLATLAAFIAESGGPEAATRVAGDTSARPERGLAARAGPGWLGKNTKLVA